MTNIHLKIVFSIKISVKAHSLIFVMKNRTTLSVFPIKKVQVGKDQEKAQTEKDSHSKNRGGKKQK